MIYTFIIFLNFFSFSVQAKEVRLTEDDLIRRIQEKNYLVQASANETDSFKYKINFWSRSFVPKFSLIYAQESYKYVVDSFRTEPWYGAALEVNLYNGGRDRLENKIYKAQLKQASASQKVILYSQLEEARKSFWNLVYLKRYLELNDKLLNLIKENKSQAIRRIRSGLATSSDKIIFEIKEEEIRQDQIKKRLKYEKEQEWLSVTLGAENEKVVPIQDLVHDHSWEKVLKHSEEAHNYLLKPAEHEVEVNVLQAEQVQSHWLPKIDAYAMWQQNNRRMDFERTNEEDRQQTIMGIKVSWNLENFLQIGNNKKSTQALAKAKQMRLEYNKQLLISKLHIEIKELKALDQLVHGAEENIKRATQLYDLIKKEYARGVKNSEDMLQATETLMNAETTRNKIVKDFHYARIHIMTKLAE